MGHAFDVATAVTRLDVPAPETATVRYATALHEGWDIGGAANGGYVLAIAGRTIADATGRRPLTITGHYLSPGLPGPAEVVVEPVRAGRRLATVTASLRRTGAGAGGGAEVLRVLATCGSAPDSPARIVDGAPPELPSYEDCIAPLLDAEATGDLPGGLFDQLAVRLRPGDEGFRFGRPTGNAEVAGWFAFADGRPIDELAMLLAVDAFPPPVFNAGIGPGWVPTIELTVHVRAVPAPGPLRCRFRTSYVHGGLLSEDGELWDGGGTLVAQSRQLALLPR